MIWMRSVRVAGREDLAAARDADGPVGEAVRLVARPDDQAGPDDGRAVTERAQRLAFRQCLARPYGYGWPSLQFGVVSGVSSGASTVAGTALRSRKTERVEMNRYCPTESFSAAAASRTHCGAVAVDAELSMTASQVRPRSARSRWRHGRRVSSSTPSNTPGALRPRLKIVTSWPRSTA
jgi:hypothetical protein